MQFQEYVILNGNKTGYALAYYDGKFQEYVILNGKKQLFYKCRGVVV